MAQFDNHIGVLVPRVLLPRTGTDLSKWAVNACDQFSSQPEYWQQAERIVGDAPSTLRMILPEVYLGRPDEDERIASIRAHMRRYLDAGVLVEQSPGFVWVRRTVNGKTRTGLIMALDLDRYDYNSGASSLIRATEGTILSRIPPRVKIRAGAQLELPHILVLIDDPEHTVIEPLDQKRMQPLYDFDLMLDGGHLEGRMVDDPEQISGVLRALEALADPAAFAAKYGPDRPPMLFAMGDGNHSFATAKSLWEQIKPSLTPHERQTHPARFALVEVENVHDQGIEFEPIHRVLFHVNVEKALVFLRERLSAQFDAGAAQGHVLPFVHAGGTGTLYVNRPEQQLPVGTLQAGLDALLKSGEFPDAQLDYIHGDGAVRALAEQPDAIGFLLPSMDKSDLFRTVVYDGALPRKTFSMGEANEKRYYMECRKLIPDTEV